MRKYIEKLTAANKSKTVGNHAVFVGIYGHRSFTYYGTDICCVDDNKKTFSVTHSGWFTSSTTQAINGYKEFFGNKGYKLIRED
ncbi:hypothetical protein [Pectinatus frisingensis]|uniref:hypothetical protein n=1 Tax=Pectinatus frisingensis TaxID=865 RepID=UPI0018C5E70B|nr:hypothetical protein [Pectinatus frisingensis]